MKKNFQNKKLQILVTIIGAIGGFLYWKFVGCASGTCPIRSVCYWSTLWGAAAGYLIGDFFNNILAKRKEKKR